MEEKIIKGSTFILKYSQKRGTKSFFFQFCIICEQNKMKEKSRGTIEKTHNRNTSAIDVHAEEMTGKPINLME